MTTSASVPQFVEASADPPVRGFLHTPVQPNGDALLLTHGAGANCQSNLLVNVAHAFAEAGFAVLRFDLPFRQVRHFGPPSPATAERDREGIRSAIEAVKQKTSGRIFVGGHSYGGRQASMLIAEQPHLVEGLLLLAYPLHPPRKPEQLRTAHFPKLRCPALFLSGTRDPFGSPEEFYAVLKLIPGRNSLCEIEGVGHELLSKKGTGDLPARIVARFQEFFQENLSYQSWKNISGT